MGLFTGIEISASGLTAQRLRMDIISNNIANVETTRSGQVDANGQPVPYRREYPVFTAGSFASYLQRGADSSDASGQQGVRVTEIAEDQSAFPLKYDPSNPDADADGYVKMPNVNTLQEMVDMIDASRAYEANISALNASKEMCSRALDIGRG
jgi:flagellar basal-body rod protein FlgC